MPKKIIPIPVAKFATNIKTNCLGFALGLNFQFEHLEKCDLEPVFIDEIPDTVASFQKKLKEFDFEQLEQISSIEDNKNRYVFMLFKFRKCLVNSFGCRYYVYDYHITRRELDGTWVHKPGWNAPPCEIKGEDDWEEIFDEFGREYYLFAL